jgi:IS5 family transposase
MPDAKTMGLWGRALGPQVIKQINERIVQIAKANDVVDGRRMRVDTTVTETNIHYPTDSSLLEDGVRVLTRTMKKITEIVGDVGAKLRDRSRSVKLRVLDIARAARSKAKQSQAKLQQNYRKIARVNQSGGRSSQAILQGDCRRRQASTGPPEATGARRLASAIRHDDAACQEGHETDPRAYLPW